MGVVGGGKPRSQPTPAFAQATQAHTYMCTLTSLPSVFLYLASPYPPSLLLLLFVKFYLSASLWISALSLSLLFSSFPFPLILLRSVLPLRVSLSTVLLSLPQCLCVHTRILSFTLYFDCTFSVLDMFRHMNTCYYVTIAYSIFSTVTCCTGL